jgi:hypothetical protein
MNNRGCNTCGAGTWRAEHADWCWTNDPTQPNRGDNEFLAYSGNNHEVIHRV